MKTQQTKHSINVIAATLISLSLIACGDGDDGINTLAKSTNIAPSAECASGGVKIQAGKDTNKNDMLDDGEITTSAVICNGANGASGVQGPVGPVGPKGPPGEIINVDL